MVFSFLGSPADIPPAFQTLKRNRKQTNSFDFLWVLVWYLVFCFFGFLDFGLGLGLDLGLVFSFFGFLGLDLSLGLVFGYFGFLGKGLSFGI